MQSDTGHDLHLELRAAPAERSLQAEETVIVVALADEAPHR